MDGRRNATDSRPRGRERGSADESELWSACGKSYAQQKFAKLLSLLQHVIQTAPWWVVHGCETARVFHNGCTTEAVDGRCGAKCCPCMRIRAICWGCDRYLLLNGIIVQQVSHGGYTENETLAANLCTPCSCRVCPALLRVLQQLQQSMQNVETASLGRKFHF